VSSIGEDPDGFQDLGLSLNNVVRERRALHPSAGKQLMCPGQRRAKYLGTVLQTGIIDGIYACPTATYMTTDERLSVSWKAVESAAVPFSDEAVAMDLTQYLIQQLDDWSQSPLRRSGRDERSSEDERSPGKLIRLGRQQLLYGRPDWRV
jgi:hypothetical protein